MKKKPAHKKIDKTIKKEDSGKKPAATLKKTAKTTTKKKEIKKGTPGNKSKETSIKKIEVKVKEKAKKEKTKPKAKKAVSKVITKKEENPKKISKEVATKTGGKSTAKVKPVNAAKPEKKVKVKLKAKAKKKPGKINAKKITKKPKRKVEVEAKVKAKVHPEKIEKFPPVPFKGLPAEYGEDSISLMTVDPHRLFTFYEVRENTLNIYRGKLTIRIYDVTGIDSESIDAHSCFDIPVNKRIGSMYTEVSPSKEYIADIGIMDKGLFIKIARSRKVSTPHAEISGEALLPQIYSLDTCFGY